MKKIILSFVAVATAVALVPMFAAFEAHVVNVTAKIENALSVTTNAIDFGTVFPQEQLDEELTVSLSGSFIAEGRVDDVEYFIRQKPKCGWTLDDGKTLLSLPTMSGHVDDQGVITCPDPGNPGRPTEAVWGPLPLLCPYISKHPDMLIGDGGNDGSTNSFHQPWIVNAGPLDWNDTLGYLSKDDDDIEDVWTIDLAVPCFGGNCAQDWESFVKRVSDDETTDASLYTQPLSNQHKIFGCDLWVEVTNVSELEF
ncbi:MAG: hypothetical protein V1712_00185 [Patescibacteria group bacterium]